VWAALQHGGRLRDVPDPRETVPCAKDLQSGSLGWRYSARGGNAPGEPGRDHTIQGMFCSGSVSLCGCSNRERELGLDRRETG
jgi:hypothetical protein